MLLVRVCELSRTYVERVFGPFACLSLTDYQQIPAKIRHTLDCYSRDLVQQMTRPFQKDTFNLYI
jgi:hypothetical protein